MKGGKVMNISKVSSCGMKECFYNKNSLCHAPAINVGGTHPRCDTFLAGSRHGGAMDMTAMVGACKVEDCRYNTELCCEAPSIDVGPHQGHGDCRTYEMK